MISAGISDNQRQQNDRCRDEHLSRSRPADFDRDFAWYSDLFHDSAGTKAEFWEKAQLLLLLRQTDFAHQFGVTWIGAQRIEPEVGPEADQRDIVSLVCSVEPIEGMVLVAQLGI